MKAKYLVMRFDTEVALKLAPKHKEIIKLEGVAGYAPIFNTLKQAEKAAGDKYQIIQIKIG